MFDANYAGGKYRCSDGICPTGMRCTAEHECTSMPIDARVDVPRDTPDDGHTGAALTCADPGVLPAGGGSASGSTVSQMNLVSASCGGFVMNGRDAVYRVSANAGQHVMVTVTGLDAYVIAPCVQTPQTPACLGNVLATPGNPISPTVAVSGSQYVVVDDSNAATSGSYSIDVMIQ